MVETESGVEQGGERGGDQGVFRLARAHWQLFTLLGVLLGAAIAVRLAVPGFEAVIGRFRPFFQIMLAGTVVAFTRSEIGITTFGMFGTVIIALSLIPLGPVVGLALFSLIFAVTLTVWFILEPYNIGTPHRVAVLIVVVAAVTTLIDVYTAPELLADLAQVLTLLPLLITSWYADRFGRQVSEEGWSVPLRRLGWTVVIILTAYAVVSLRPLVDLLVRVPELWAILVAVNVYAGTRNSTRLMEFWRFRSIPNAGAPGDHLRRALDRFWVLVGRRRNEEPAEMDGIPESEVLSMNHRNRHYIKEYNPSHLYPSLDKLSVKRSFHGLDIPTPETYAIVDDQRALADTANRIAGREDFVVKPVRSYGGEGILVVTGRTENGEFQTRQGVLSREELLGRVRAIIDGRYSREPTGGKAIIEDRVVTTPYFRRLCGDGIPDVRVLTFRGHPVMAMARLPTTESGGLANLHKGGIGVGLSVADGTALAAYQQTTDQWLETHPDTGADLLELAIDDWESILALASKAAAASKLGYAGVDIVFDETHGPFVLEVNKRPGLGIQNACRAGLRPRLEFVEQQPTAIEFRSSREKAAHAREWASADWEPTRSDDTTGA